VRFDDRLMTVLNQPSGDRHDVAVRWRQLVDLVARAGSNSASPTVAQALDTIRADAPAVDDKLRAAAARAVAALPVPLGLLEYFASDGLTISAPVLAAATLEPTQWRALLSAADEETRRFVEALHPELRAEPPLDLTDTLVEPRDDPESAPAAPPPASPSLHDVVTRIERRRRSRSSSSRTSGTAAGGDASPALFRWECGPGGEIAWVEGAPRGALIGRSISRPLESEGGHVDQDVVRAFALRAPFRDAALTLAGDGLVAGEWKISGVPAFDPADGRFAGYRGVALREQGAEEPLEPAADLLSDPDSLRELVHEIKTPLNAIIGFAEIIEGQYLGPADRRYRERAHEIVHHARLLVTAIDDLDFAAKVHSSTWGTAQRVNIGELVERLAPTLRDIAAARAVTLDGSRPIRESMAAVEPELADRLIYRMCSAAIEQAQSGERLRLWVDQSRDNVRVAVTCPSSLSALSEEELLGSGVGSDQGFSLRLVRGLARIAGAELTARENSLSLVLPGA
jgi:signal transduction histidine kinase